jgi:hypothetical protein
MAQIEMGQPGRDARTPQGIPHSSPASSPKSSRTTQCEKLLALFLSHPNRWIPLPAIMRAGGSQYSARVCELRKAGSKVQNTTLEIVAGVKHTAFRIPKEAREAK